MPDARCMVPVQLIIFYGEEQITNSKVAFKSKLGFTMFQKNCGYGRKA